MARPTTRNVIVLATTLLLASWTPRANAKAALLVLLFGEEVASEQFYVSLKLGATVADVKNVEGDRPASG